jgi:hypothetical protein
MSETKNYPFTTPTNYTYDPTKIEVTGGIAKLKTALAGITAFSEDFADDTGFTYDAAKAEFTGGVVRQKAQSANENYSRGVVTQSTTQVKTEAYSRGAVTQTTQRPTDATFGVTFTTDINGSWGDGTLTGTATGGASVSGGKLDLAHSDTRYVRYSAVGNASARQIGCVRFKLTPNYSGSPSSEQCFFDIGRSTDLDYDSLQIRHKTNGALQVRMCDQYGNYIIQSESGPWGQTSGTEYIFEWNFDFTAGSSRLFINGTQYSSHHLGTGTRSANIEYIWLGTSHGGGHTSNFYIDSFEFFTTVQHTADHTAGYSVPEKDYPAGVSIYSTFTYTYLVSSLGVPTIVSANTPHYVVNGKYWDGTAWSSSADTYATSMTSAQWITNYASFPSASLGASLIVKVVFQDTNTAASVTSVDLTVNEFNYVEALYSYSALAYANIIDSLGVPSITDSNNAKYIVNGYAYFGGSWQVSSNTYATAMTKTDWIAQYASFPSGQLGTALVVKTVFPEQLVVGSVTSVQLTVIEHNYAETSVLMPDYVYSGPGAEIRLNNGTTTETGSPHYTINGMYWNGVEFVASDGSYAQANTKTAIVALMPVLIPSNTLSVAIKFPAGIIQNNLDQMDFDLSGHYYNQTDPTLQLNDTTKTSELLTFVETATKTGSEIKWTIIIDGVEKYYSGGWVASNGTYAQANTAADIQTNAATILNTRATLAIKGFLHSNDGSQTPLLDNLEISYDSALPDPTAATLIELEGFLYLKNAPRANLTVYARPYLAGGVNAGVFEVYEYTTLGVSNSVGWFEADIYVNPTATFIEMKIGKQSYMVDLSGKSGTVDISTLTFTKVED